jgi:hypothetical protein
MRADRLVQLVEPGGQLTKPGLDLLGELPNSWLCSFG